MSYSGLKGRTVLNFYLRTLIFRIKILTCSSGFSNADYRLFKLH